MKKMVRLISVLLLGAVLITGCSGAKKLSADFDEAEVKKAAEEVIGKVNDGDYAALVEEQFGAKLKVALTEDGLLEKVAPIIDELGTFESIDKSVVAGSADKDTDEEFAVAIVVVKYSEGKAQFTLSFNKQMKLEGFFIK